MKTIVKLISALGVASIVATAPASAAPVHASPAVSYNSVKVNGNTVYYREAGPANAPVLLLLHGYPSSSHMFRNLIPKLAGKYHVIAPDLPGFGMTEVATDKKFVYTFDNLAQVIDEFTVAKKLDRFAIYVFDYGAPVGWRLAVAHPEKITAIISQNGNAYEAGLSTAWAPIQAYWKDNTPANREAIAGMLKPETTKWQYAEGVKDATTLPPDGYNLDQYFLDRPGQKDIQLDLFYDYRNNVAMYPKLHEYFRKNQPPLLAVWGKNDPFFLPPGAEAFKQDLPKAEVSFLDTGHFALETHNDEIAAKILDFLGRKLK
jgi:pimeloyl-ACP methyl ester carboxylesterase